MDATPSSRPRRLLLRGGLLGAAALLVGMVSPAISQAAAAGAGSSSPSLASAASPSSAFSPSSPSSGPSSHRLAHVFIIMEENHAADHVLGDPNMPFLDQLAASNGVATNYYGVTHTSEPNYIAATSGSNWWVNNDNGWYQGNQYDHTNIVDELAAKHIPWAAYMQAMPSAGYQPDGWPTKDSLYVSKHDPFMLYTDVRDNPARADQVKPYADLASDLNGGDIPRYVWISPDVCDDMHGGVSAAIPGRPETPCPYANTAGDANDEALKAKADAFLQTTVNTIIHSKAWTGNSVIFVTADETDYDGSSPDNGDYLSTAGCCDSPTLPAGDSEISPNWPGGVYGGGLVPMIVVSRQAPGHVTDATPYNHYSMLLTIEQGLGLGALAYTADSAQVKPMWNLVAH